MKKIVVLFILLISSVSVSIAQNRPNKVPHMSPVEFREKQQAFITEQADLSPEEATRFFPLYSQMQEKKKELNDEAWKLIKEGNEKNLTEAQYNDILEGIYNSRISVAELEKSYYAKFKQILSPKKIFLIQRAEMRFHREIIKGINDKGECKHHSSSGKKAKS